MLSNVILQKKQRMKNAVYIVNGILLIAVGILFYLHFSEKKGSAVLDTSARENNSKGQGPANGFKIGYFEWDSIQSNFKQFKEMQDEILQKDDQNEKVKMQLRTKYQNAVNGYSQKQLSQVESEAAAKDLKNLEIEITNQMQSLDNELQDFRMRKQNEIKTKIEDFLNEYNKDKGYAFIFAYEPALIFYKDSAYNITKDLVKGLNEKYSSKKK